MDHRSSKKAYRTEKSYLESVGKEPLSPVGDVRGRRGHSEEKRLREAVCSEVRRKGDATVSIGSRYQLAVSSIGTLLEGWRCSGV